MTAEQIMMGVIVLLSGVVQAFVAHVVRRMMGDIREIRTDVRTLQDARIRDEARAEAAAAVGPLADLARLVTDAGARRTHRGGGRDE